jgi:hypothetical protein
MRARDVTPPTEAGTNRLGAIRVTTLNLTLATPRQTFD